MVWFYFGGWERKKKSVRLRIRCTLTSDFTCTCHSFQIYRMIWSFVVGMWKKKFFYLFQVLLRPAWNETCLEADFCLSKVMNVENKRIPNRKVQPGLRIVALRCEPYLRAGVKHFEVQLPAVDRQPLMVQRVCKRDTREREKRDKTYRHKYHCSFFLFDLCILCLWVTYILNLSFTN